MKMNEEEFEKLIQRDIDLTVTFYGKQDSWIRNRIEYLMKIEEDTDLHILKTTTKDMRRRWKKEDFLEYKAQLLQKTAEELKDCKDEEARRLQRIEEKKKYQRELKAKLGSNKAYRERIKAGLHIPTPQQKKIMTEEDFLEEAEIQTAELIRMQEIAKQEEDAEVDRISRELGLED